MLQVDLFDFAWQESAHGGGGGGRAVGEQDETGRGRRVVGSDAEQLGGLGEACDALLDPLAAGRIQPVDEAAQARAPQGSAALVQQRADVGGQAVEPAPRKDVPPRAGGLDEPGAARLRDEPAARLLRDEAGVRGDGEVRPDAAQVDRHGVGEPLRVGQGYAALGELARGLALEFAQELGDPRGRGERAFGGDAVDEAHLRGRDGVERGERHRRGELLPGGEAECGPGTQLFGDRRVEDDAGGALLGEQRADSDATPGGGLGGGSGGIRFAAREIRQHCERGPVEARQPMLDRRAVEEGVGEVEEVLDADRAQVPVADRRGESGIVELSQAGGEGEDVTHARSTAGVRPATLTCPWQDCDRRRFRRRGRRCARAGGRSPRPARRSARWRAGGRRAGRG